MRDRQILFIAGMSRSGKTILARHIAAVSKSFKVVDPAFSWGKAGMWGPDPWALVSTELRKGFNGTLIFDDADRYIPKSGNADTWGTLWTTHRHIGVDLVLIARRVHDLPPVVWSSATRLICFRMKPGSLEANYLHEKGYIPTGHKIPDPRQKFTYLDVDLDGDSAITRKITPAQLNKYGSATGQ